MGNATQWPWLDIKNKCVEMTDEEWETLDYECPFCGKSSMEFTLKVFTDPGDLPN